MKIEITPEQQNALLKMLDSITIKGSEAQFLIDLKGALMRPEEAENGTKDR